MFNELTTDRARRRVVFLLVAVIVHGPLIALLLWSRTQPRIEHRPDPGIEIKFVQIDPPRRLPVGLPAAPKTLQPKLVGRHLRKTAPETIAPVQPIPERQPSAIAGPRPGINPVQPLVGNQTAVAQSLGSSSGEPSSSGGGSGVVAEGDPSAAIAPSYDAAYLHNPPPQYPAAARRLKLQGTTLIRALVSAEGRPQSVRVETSSGVQLLDEAALEAVRNWSFVPARQGDKSVAAEVDVPVRFHLSGAAELPDGSTSNHR